MKRQIIIKSLLILIGVILPIVSIQAQYFDMGQDPSSVRWRQIQTDHFQVIFPRENEEQAQSLARKLEAAFDYLTYTMHASPRKMSVILHSFSTFSNALNGWAPRRLEMWPVPDQETYGQDWIEQLAIHEVRHTVQVEKMNQGIGKILSVMLGEQSQALTVGLFVPFWFLEGDAVATETALSTIGRGRDPNFTQQLRALVLQKHIVDYDQLILGSFQHKIPDHYVVGYHSVAINRLYKGASYYDNKLDEVARYSWFGNVFSKKSNDLRDRSHIKHVAFAIDKLDSLWRSSFNFVDSFPSLEITPSAFLYASYFSPVILSDGVWALRESLSKIPQIVKIANGMEVSSKDIGYSAEEHLGGYGHYLVWSEKRFDVRWQNRAWNEIVLYNTQTQKTNRVTHKSRLFYPVLNSLEEIAAVDISLQGKNSIVLLSINGDLLPSKIPNPANDFLMQPSWSFDGTQLIFVAITQKGKELRLWDRKTEEVSVIKKASSLEISHPSFGNNTIYYTSADSGIHIIHSLSLVDGSDEAIVPSEFGGDYAVEDRVGGRLIYADYSANGYSLKEICIDSVSQSSIITSSVLPFDLAGKLAQQEMGVVDFNVDSGLVFSSKSYSKWNLLNLHSWFPFYLSQDYNNTGFPGITLMSQNKLSNTIMYASYNGDSRYQDERYAIGLSFKMFFPVLDITYKAGTIDNRSFVGNVVRYGIDDYTIISASDARVSDLRATLSFPLKLSRRFWQRGVIPYGSYGVERKESIALGLKMYGSQDRYVAEVASEAVSSFTQGVIYYNYKQMASRDLFPRWGERLDFYAKQSTGTIDYGTLLAGKWLQYLPGLFPSQHMFFSLGYQKRTYGGGGGYSNFLDFPRGGVSLKNVRLMSFLSDYYLPIGYPDLGVGWLAYVKRIGLSGFYDYSWSENTDIITSLWSAGGSFWADFYLFRYEVPLRFEIRLGYNSYQNGLFNEFLFSYSF